MTNHRPTCYQCNRPKSLCLCKKISPVKTNTKFVLLIHPKEFKHIKNNTGRLTHLSLPNSELFVGVDFSEHKRLNTILQNPENECYILFPSQESLSLETSDIPKEGKQLVIILIDATWSSAKPMLRLSKNLHHLPKLSFSHSKNSAYTFKRQPFTQALSTMESTQVVLEILTQKGVENIAVEKLDNFLNPFYEMIDYQLKFNP